MVHSIWEQNIAGTKWNSVTLRRRDRRNYSSPHFFAVHRQIPEPDAGCVVNGIGNGRGHGNDADLPDALAAKRSMRVIGFNDDDVQRDDGRENARFHPDPLSEGIISLRPAFSAPFQPARDRDSDPCPQGPSGGIFLPPAGPQLQTGHPQVIAGNRQFIQPVGNPQQQAADPLEITQTVVDPGPDVHQGGFLRVLKPGSDTYFPDEIIVFLPYQLIYRW